MNQGPPRVTTNTRRMYSGAVITVVILALFVGCATRGQRVFDSAALGAHWSDVPKHYIYADLGQLRARYTSSRQIQLSLCPSPHSYYEDLVVGNGCVCYYVVVNTDDIVVAKAMRKNGTGDRRVLVITVQGLAELLDVERHYPFATRTATIPEVDLEVRVTEYPPLLDPSGPDDPTLSSGVRASLWAGLASVLNGWPASMSDHREVVVKIDGREVDWHSVVEKISSGVLSGTVEIRER